MEIMGEQWEESAEYVEAHIPDKEKLGMYLRMAKGAGRTMAQFAEACSVSPSTFSRILNGNLTRPLSKEMILAILSNAADPGVVSLDQLMRANGLVPKGEMQPQGDVETGNTVNGNPPKSDRSEAGILSEAKNIIVQELSARGYMLQMFPRLQIHMLPKGKYGLRRFSDLAIHVQGFEPKYWNFIIVDAYRDGQSFLDASPRAQETVGQAVLGSHVSGGQVSMTNEKLPDRVAKTVISRYAEVFLKDIWEPEVITEIKTTFVFGNAVVFQSFWEILSQKKVNGEISILLLDYKEKKVMYEAMLPRNSGEAHGSLFDKAPLEDEDSDFEDNM